MVKIIDEVNKYLPQDANITEAVFEGANIVLYTKNKKFLLDNQGVIKTIVENIKKRVELRADPSIVKDIEDTKELIKKTIPADAGETEIIFDTFRSRVIIEAEKPGIAIGKGGEILKEIKNQTLWTPIVRRIPPIRSQLLENIRQVLYDNSEYRRKFLHKVGKRIYEGWTKTKRDEWVRMTCLGSAREVGRSCFLIQTPESTVMLDCGFNVAAPREYAFPYLDVPEFNIQELDAVILSHPHIDHCLPADTLVELENGILKPIDNIDRGDKILTINLKTGKKEINECLEKVRTYTHKKIINIKTPYNTIEASPNHKFFVIENMEIKELEAKDLKVGMIIPINNISLDEINNTITCQVINKNLEILGLNETHERKSFFENMDLSYYKISEIEVYDNPYEYLVDIKVANNSNFIANGILVHNCGTLPYLYKMGYRGPVYCTAPTRDVAALLCLDMSDIAMKEGNDPLYDTGDVKEMVKHTICLDYEEVSDITPDMRLTLYNAGHNLGSAMVHLHIGNGAHNFLYTGDFNYETSNLLSSAIDKFPRVESVMMESTYGTKADNSPSRKESEDELIRIINETALAGGKILMPVLGVGRSQECMLILERAMVEKKIPEMPIYVQGMVWDVTALHTAYPDFLSNRVKKGIFQRDHNPFLSPIFKKVISQKEMTEIKEGKGPYIVMATSGMLQGGPSLEYLKAFAENPKNCVVLTSYQGVGSIGRRLQDGEKELTFTYGGSKRMETIKINLPIYTLSGFSGHSNFKQLTAWVRNMEPKPKKFITIHGDYSRCIELASVIYQQNRVETVAPKNLETIRLR
ncbi:MBL fold metallo-hydrolase [Candidatus Woesearchaeota archaeon]|nr:MAG: hypothetical protein QT09_C0006G0076 [archaeon GW2011_AR18]MBS3161752.1 MBL fold metallo-hydrolase [Candidatus Woesearchaeota archaeon]HIH26292.1 MBL fold metallo-hydrolase [Nanoarchaeota archaeon]